MKQLVDVKNRKHRHRNFALCNLKLVSFESFPLLWLLDLERKATKKLKLCDVSSFLQPCSENV